MLHSRRIGWLLIVAGAALSVATAVRAEEPKAAAPATPTPAASAPAVTAPVTTGQAETQTTTPEEVKAALKPRGERYWAARQSRDLRTVYELESAAQPGGWLKLENAMSLQGLPVRKVKVETVRIEGDRGFVRVSGEILVGTLGWTPQSMEDPWILLNGQWYHETPRN